MTRESADEVLEVVENLRETLTSKRLPEEVSPVLSKLESLARYAKGERVGLSYRVQTAGEYNPPMPDEKMKEEVFGRVARLILVRLGLPHA